MKKSLLLLVVALLIAALMVACGGGSTTPQTQAEVPAAVEEAAEAVVEADEQPQEAEEAEAEAPAAEEPAEAPAEEEAAPEAEAEAPADAAVAAEDLPMSGIDAETGLEINPPVTQPGVDYIIRGKLSSFNLVPQTSPEFLIQGPPGLRYRVQTQAVPEILVADGSEIALHQFVPGLSVQATARLTESDRATSVMISDNMIILSLTP